MKTYNKAFTLVELIVVIVILSILATLAVLSFGSQSSSARDSTRLSDLASLSKWLGVKVVTTWAYPMPDSWVSIYASWILIWYQWNIWNSVLTQINASQWGFQDPIDKNYYTYSINSSKNKFQILTFLENQSSIWFDLSPLSLSINALDYLNRYPYTRWDLVWIILSWWTLEPIQSNYNQASLTWINISNTNTLYTIQFSNNDSASWTWFSLLGNLLSRRSDLSSNVLIYSADSSIIWYWDMETLSWTKLKDMTWRWNDWTFNWTLPIDWKISKWRDFNGTSDYIDFWNPNILKVTDNFSISLWFRKKWWPTWYPAIISHWSMWWAIWLSNLAWDVWKIFVSQSTQPPYINSTTIPQDLAWYFLVVTKQWNVTNIYVNWVKEGSFAASPTFTISDTLRIWKDQLWVWYWQWTVDETKIYSRVISDNEILSQYNLSK